MRASLTIEQGEATPPRYDLIPSEPVTLGRHPNNTIVLRDEHVSRWHAVIVSEGGRWFIGDIGNPTNGTTVNGECIARQTELSPGCEIGLSDIRIRFACRPEPDSSIPSPKTRSWAATPLLVDELTVLCEFLARSLEETDPRTLIRHALQIIQKETRATAAGFLSLEPEGPLAKLIWPEEAQVDIHLSRQLTAQVLREKRTAWLAGGNLLKQLPNDFAPFTDAMCVPLRACQSIPAALHIYKAMNKFNERHQRFCELLGSYLVSRLADLRNRRSLQAENSRLRQQIPSADEIIGASPVIGKLREQIARAASRSSVALITGESGVGKELVALALHRQSPRHDGPLVVVNCAAIAPALFEAELFGHRKGAFTGADRDRPGLFQQADEGTIFLDEIGELPLECQAKLLRIIEGHGFRPVGGIVEIRSDVRVIAATNRDLAEEVKKDTFRRDLLFRLQVIQLRVPPLREHPEDIPALAKFFLTKLSSGRSPPQLTESAMRRLQAYAWPGNVRQLRAVLENVLAMSDRASITAQDIVLATDLPVHPASAVGSLHLDDLETWAITQALQRTGGNITQAARLLGMVRDTLAYKMKQKGIDKKMMSREPAG